jgi:hypothetical protein
MSLRVLFPGPCNNERVGHILYSLVYHLAGTGLEAERWVLRRGPSRVTRRGRGA